MNLRCENCGFDLSEFDADVWFTPGDLENVNPVDPSRNLYCPLCGNGVPLALSTLGVVVRREVVSGHASLRLMQWIAKGEKARAGQVSVGSLTVGFGRSSDGPSGAREGIVEAIDPADIFYKMVPAFRNRDGSLVVPTLPVRPEHFDLVDLDAIDRADGRFEPGHIEAGMYRARIPLKGREAPWPVSVRVMPSKVGRSPSAPEQDAFRGVSLSVWPDVPYREWNYFRTELRVHDDEGLDLLARERPLSIGVYRQGEGFRALAEAREDGRGFFDVSTSGRPEWLSVAFEGSQPAGGVFQVWVPGERRVLEDHMVEIALDLGTSNTCVAFQGAEGPTLMPIRDLRRVVFDGATPVLPEAQTHPDTAPPRKGFGVHGDLLPSEVLYRKGGNLAALQQGLSRVRDWIPFLDYGIPSAGVRPAYDEASSILAEFKMQNEDAKDPGLLADPVRRIDVFERYVVALLLLESAHALAAMPTPLFVAGRVFVVKYSYPGVLQESADELHGIVERAAAQVAGFTGIQFKVDPATVDEARAAGRNVEGGVDGMRVYIDMGGGSTDIAMYYQRGTDPNPEPVFLTSIRYAGGVALKAMCGDGEKPISCLHPSMTPESLRRGIREANRLSDLIKNPNYFRSDRFAVRNRRAGLYFGYLIEYQARLLAAAFLSGDYLRYVKKRTQQEPLYPEPFEIELILIGNGWGFLSAIDEGTPNLVARLLQSRTMAVLKESLANEAALARVTDARGRHPLNLQMKIVLKDLQQLFRGAKAHAKAAVAFGLLKPDAGGQAGDMTRCSIVGLTTTVDGQHRATWDMPIRAGGDGPTTEYEIRSSSSLTWDLSATPCGWRQLNLMSPDELDPGLAETRSILWRRTLPKTGFLLWFARSPFEVLMEQLFAKRIPREGA